MLGEGGREQRLTWGMLRDAVVGMWGVMYKGGRGYGCDFAIGDLRWGVVGGGRLGGS